MANDNEDVGTVVLIVDGVEYDCTGITVTKQGGWMARPTMNSAGQTRRKSRKNRGYTLAVSVLIPDGKDSVDWDNLTDATLIVESLSGAYREIYSDCSTSDSTSTYDLNGETKRDLNLFALGYIKE